MPERTSKARKPPTIRTIDDLRKMQGVTSPCGKQDRDPLDIVGRFNDLINCYLETAGEYLRVYLPMAIIALLLFLVMLFTAYQFLKG